MKEFEIKYANEIRKRVLDSIEYNDIGFIEYITEITDQNFFLKNQDIDKCYNKLKECYESKKSISESRDIVLERTIIKLNEHDFKIKPITLGEEIDFQSDFKYSIIPEIKDREYNDSDICELMMGLFTDRTRITDKFGIVALKNKSMFQLF